jgi:hypothetical protein
MRGGNKKVIKAIRDIFKISRKKELNLEKVHRTHLDKKQKKNISTKLPFLRYDTK